MRGQLFLNFFRGTKGVTHLLWANPHVWATYSPPPPPGGGGQLAAVGSASTEGVNFPGWQNDAKANGLLGEYRRGANLLKDQPGRDKEGRQLPKGGQLAKGGRYGRNSWGQLAIFGP